MGLARKPASATAQGEVTTGEQTFAGNKIWTGDHEFQGSVAIAGSLAPAGGIVGKTDGAAVAAGNVGEVTTVANTSSFTGGVVYKDAATTALTGSLAIILSRTLSKGTYLVGYVSTAAISGATSLQGRLRVGGTALTPDLFNHAASGGVSITQPMVPVRIDTDGTTVQLLLAMGGGSATHVHELYIVRSA